VSGAGSGGTSGTAGFTVTLEPSTLSLPRGASAWLTVRVEREPGFSDPVRVTFENLPPGLAAETVTLPESVSSGILPLLSGDNLAEGSELELEATGSSGPGTTSVAVHLLIAAAQPSSQEKIRAALVDGELDYETSLLYRAYALVGDARLPDEFVGSGSDEEDSGLAYELWTRFDTLPEDAQDDLRPFLVRPTASESIWNGGGGALPLSDEPRASLELPAPSSCPEESASTGPWISRAGAEPVRAWAQCRGEPAGDAETERLVQKTLAVLDKIYGPMTRTMTDPIGDLEGGDPFIDFYIVDPGVSIVRRGASFAPAGLGSTYSDYPEIGKGASAFVTLPRSLLYMSRFHSTVIHEFFHVLQKAYNHQYAHQELTASNVYVAHWFPEASAVWASAHFDRTLAPWDDGRAAYLDAHARFIQRFQPSRLALNASESVPHNYAAYIWSYFVEQETESPEFMAQIWEGLTGVSSFEQADDAIDGVHPFHEHFKDFALRNLNAEFLPGDPLPRRERYVALDSDFLDGPTPPYLEGTLEAEQEFRQDLPLPNLAARYVFLEAGSTIRKATFQFADLQPQDQVDVQALVHTFDGWVPEPLDFSSENEVVFCFDKGPATATRRGSFSAILLVISNHAVRADSQVSGALVVQPTADPCAPVWQGTISAEYRADVELGTVTWSSTTPVVFEFDDSEPTLPFSTPYRLRSGTYTYQWLGDYTNRTPTCRTRESASGTMIPDTVPSGTPGHAWGTLRIDTFFAPATYQGSGFAIGIGELTSDCNDNNIESTYEYFPPFTWWTMNQPQEVSEDGNTLEGTFDAPDGAGGNTRYTWRLERIDE
jgi:hypothetical protein